jgi:hypothetical protein
MSGLDKNYNSDNYQSNSTGSTEYPGRFLDDDDLARKISYGYIRRNGVWQNIFWNNYLFDAQIRKNENNTGALAQFPDTTSTGMLQIELDGAYSMKVVEFDPDTYLGTKELKIESTLNTTSSTGAIGYLQSNMSVSTGTTNAKIFDLKNKNYGIFVSGSGSSTTYLKYKFSFVNQSGSLIYTVPLDDSDPYQMTYYGSDIMIDTENNYITKQQEITRPK